MPKPRERRREAILRRRVSDFTPRQRRHGAVSHSPKRCSADPADAPGSQVNAGQVSDAIHPVVERDAMKV